MTNGFDPRRAHHWIAFGLGSGLVPWAPGTFGTIAAIPLYLILALLPLGGYLVALAVVIVLGVWACDRTARDLGDQDPGAIVWDEFAGLLVTLAGAPAGWGWVVAGFVLFRGFDILKPWPISWLDRRLTGGLGIMLDDLAAGLAAWACLHFVSRAFG
ncbi:MAG TPA: phosphatidylglycerophosphatase A [Lamprocystis sp. (in: g-proteobacteria)]|nr:phosphatidylglycerophosphatase A [Lamprocystis sp. (in: g-proteobacteria)]